jgi:hypothetical protein
LHQPPQLDDQSGAAHEIRRQPKGFEVLNIWSVQRERTIIFFAVTSFGDFFCRQNRNGTTVGARAMTITL